MQLPFERYQLDNGLSVILHRDPSLPIVAVNLWFRVGAKDEVPGRSGFAHLFEHLMFMGTDAVPNFDILLEDGGGWSNASTSEDRTNYYAVGPATLIDTLLYLDADRLANLGRSMTQEKLELQRSVVLNERRQSYENAPYAKAWLEIPPGMYPAGHPYAHPVIGSVEDIQAATLEDVRDFFDTYYAPANATLVVAGDFDPAAVKARIDQTFGLIPARPAPPAITVAPVSLPTQATVTLYDRVEVPKLILLWHSPSFLAPGDAEMDVTSSVLSKGKSSRLYKRLVYERQIASSVVAMQSSGLASLFIIEVTAERGSDLQALEAAVDEVLEELIATGPTTDELERAINGIETSFIRQLQAVARRADLLNQYAFYTDTPDYLARDMARYAQIAPTQVHQVLRQVLAGGSQKRMRIEILPMSDAPAAPTP